MPVRVPRLVALPQYFLKRCEAPKRLVPVLPAVFMDTPPLRPLQVCNDIVQVQHPMGTLQIRSLENADIKASSILLSRSFSRREWQSMDSVTYPSLPQHFLNSLETHWVPNSVTPTIAKPDLPQDF